MNWLRTLLTKLNSPIGELIPSFDRPETADVNTEAVCGAARALTDDKGGRREQNRDEIDVLAQSSELSAIPQDLRRELSEAVASSDTERARVLTRKAFALRGKE